MMGCLRTRRLISAFLDRELDPPTSSSLSAHIGWCLWCRRQVERVERGARLAQEARDVVVPSPPSGVFEEITALPRVPDEPGRKRFPVLMTLTASAAIVLALSIWAQYFPVSYWPLGVNSTVYALDFGFEDPKLDGNLLSAFRTRYDGKFREFVHDGPPDPGWVPFLFKFPSQLPSGMSLRSVMIFDPRYCGSLALIFSDGARDLYLVQQPADRPISLTGLKTSKDEVCKYNATHCTLGPYRLMTWEADGLRSVLITNLSETQIESTVDSLRQVP